MMADRPGSAVEKRWVAPAVLCALGVAAALAVYYATFWGPWTFSDGVGYMVSARNLVDGPGLGLVKPSGEFEQLVSHPPLHPVTLAALYILIGDILSAARWLDILAFSVFVAGTGLLFYRLSGSLWMSAALSATLALSPGIVLAFTSAMAEPLFLTLAVISTMLLAIYLHQRSLRWLIGSACLMGLAVLTRYPAIAFVLGALALILWIPRERFHRRVAVAAAYGLLALLPVALFFAWTQTLAGAAAPKAVNPSVDLGPALTRFAGALTGIVWSWKPLSPELMHIVRTIISGSIGLAVLSLSLGLALAIVAALAVRRRRPGGMPASDSGLRELLAVALVMAAAYLLAYLFTYLVTYPTPDVDSRTMLPLYVWLLLAGFAGLGLLVASRRLSSTAAGAAWLALTVLMVGNSVLSIDILTGLHRTGLGYTSERWRSSPTIQAIERLPQELAWISNEPMPILLYTGRWPFQIDEIVDHRADPSFPSFGDGNSDAERLFRQEGARLILFDTVLGQFDMLYSVSAHERLDAFVQGLVTESLHEDGTILRYPAADMDP